MKIKKVVKKISKILVFIIANAPITALAQDENYKTVTSCPAQKDYDCTSIMPKNCDQKDFYLDVYNALVTPLKAVIESDDWQELSAAYARLTAEDLPDDYGVITDENGKYKYEDIIGKKGYNTLKDLYPDLFSDNKVNCFLLKGITDKIKDNGDFIDSENVDFMYQKIYKNSCNTDVQTFSQKTANYTKQVKNLMNVIYEKNIKGIYRKKSTDDQGNILLSDNQICYVDAPEISAQQPKYTSFTLGDSTPYKISIQQIDNFNQIDLNKLTKYSNCLYDYLTNICKEKPQEPPTQSAFDKFASTGAGQLTFMVVGFGILVPAIGFIGTKMFKSLPKFNNWVKGKFIPWDKLSGQDFLKQMESIKGKFKISGADADLLKAATKDSGNVIKTGENSFIKLDKLSGEWKVLSENEIANLGKEIKFKAPELKMEGLTRDMKLLSAEEKELMAGLKFVRP